MERASAAALTPDQITFLNQLRQAVNQINEADDLLANNTSSDLASRRATALLLAAIARTLVVEAAEKHGLDRRLPPFKHPSAQS